MTTEIDVAAIMKAPSTGPAIATPELMKKFQPATRISWSDGTYMGTAAWLAGVWNAAQRTAARWRT